MFGPTGFAIPVSVVLAMLRILGFKDVAYQAIAHLWVGGMIGAAIVNRDPILIWCVIGMSVVEVVCFIAFGRMSRERGVDIHQRRGSGPGAL